MTDRTAQILEAAIQEFINTGDPVSSGLLYDRYDFGIKPAMIRLELDVLEDEGYLEQPHYSAGRVPTDGGYEFFAGQVLRAGSPKEKEGAARDFFEEQAWPDFLHKISMELGILGVIAGLPNDQIYKVGLESLIRHLDWEEREELDAVIHDFETIDKRLPHAAEKLENGPKVFVGKNTTNNLQRCNC